MLQKIAAREDENGERRERERARLHKLVRAQTAFATTVFNIHRRVENKLSGGTKKLPDVTPGVWKLASACKTASSLRLVLATGAHSIHLSPVCPHKA